MKSMVLQRALIQTVTAPLVRKKIVKDGANIVLQASLTAESHDP